MKFCTNCGSQIPDDAKFCTNCGHPMNQEQPAPERPVQTPAQPEEEKQTAFTPPEPPEVEKFVIPPYVPPKSPVSSMPEHEKPEHVAPPTQQTYGAPVQQTYEVPTQSYEAPNQQSYEAPNQQNYQAPNGAYPPPNAGGGNNYVPPFPPNSGKPPKAPKGPKKSSQMKPGSKNPLVFIILGILVLAMVIGLVACIASGGSKDKDDPLLGIYDATSCLYDGMEVGCEDEWIELKSKGKAVIGMGGDEFKAKWELDGYDLTVEQGGDIFYGNLDNGTITLDLGGLLYTYEKEGGKPELNRPAKDDKRESIAGYWTLLKLESTDPEMNMDEETAKALKDMDMEFYMVLEEDGTGVFSMAWPVAVTWTDRTISPESMLSMAYEVRDDTVIVDMEGDLLYFVRGTGPAPEANLGGSDFGDLAGEGSLYSWWNGGWFGWMVIDDAADSLKDSVGNAWDVCAKIQVNADDTGRILIYDSDNEPGEGFCESTVTFGAGTTENGCMMSESGYFYDDDIEHADWIIDPGASPVSTIEDMICIQSRYVDSSDSSLWMDYSIFLRPWGMRWDDVRTDYGDEMPYYDMRPISYDTWYLPMIEANQPMPDTMNVDPPVN